MMPTKTDVPRCIAPRERSPGGGLVRYKIVDSDGRGGGKYILARNADEAATLFREVRTLPPDSPVTVTALPD